MSVRLPASRMSTKSDTFIQREPMMSLKGGDDKIFFGAVRFVDRPGEQSARRAMREIVAP